MAVRKQTRRVQTWDRAGPVLMPTERGLRSWCWPTMSNLTPAFSDCGVCLACDSKGSSTGALSKVLMPRQSL